MAFCVTISRNNLVDLETSYEINQALVCYKMVGPRYDVSSMKTLLSVCFKVPVEHK